MSNDAGATRPDADPGPARLPAGPGLRRLDSRSLLGGAREVEIVHGRTIYRLRRTDQDKLILTK